MTTTDHNDDTGPIPVTSLEVSAGEADNLVEPVNGTMATMAFAGGASNSFLPQETLHSVDPLPDATDSWSQLDFDLSFPSFFESIMVPESNWTGAGEVQMPPDLAAIIPDYEDWTGNGDIFGFDFSTAFEQVMDGTNSMQSEAAVVGGAQASDGSGADTSTVSARQRHHIFQKSPW